MGRDVGDQIPVCLELDYLGNKKESHIMEAFAMARKQRLLLGFPPPTGPMCRSPTPRVKAGAVIVRMVIEISRQPSNCMRTGSLFP